MTKRILRLPAVKDRTGLSGSTVWDWVSREKFPAPIKLGPRAVGWLESEVDAWIDARIACSDSAG